MEKGLKSYKLKKLLPGKNLALGWIFVIPGAFNEKHLYLIFQKKICQIFSEDKLNPHLNMPITTSLWIPRVGKISGLFLFKISNKNEKYLLQNLVVL